MPRYTSTTASTRPRSTKLPLTTEHPAGATPVERDCLWAKLHREGTLDRSGPNGRETRVNQALLLQVIAAYLTISATHPAAIFAVQGSTFRQLPGGGPRRGWYSSNRRNHFDVASTMGRPRQPGRRVSTEVGTWGGGDRCESYSRLLSRSGSAPLLPVLITVETSHVQLANTMTRSTRASCTDMSWDGPGTAIRLLPGQ